ncbi:MAG TPA: RodZ domain-containing protein [Bryobacteraceae bacterium]|nr:RodZ domain-containing protein [Bryobacteraceae bacterium]
MLSAGEILRNERQKQGLDLSSVSKQTKISERILTAIEKDEVSQIPSAFVYKSFARQVATTLRVDFAQIANQVNLTADKFPEVRIPGQNVRRPDVPPIRQRRESISGLVRGVISLLAVVALCSGLYAYLNRMQMSDLTAGFVDAAPENESTTSNAQPQPSQEAIQLKVGAVEQSWLTFESDGHRVFSGLLEPAQTKVFEGREMARMRTGNAGGVTVVFNGRDLGPLGERGQVRTVVFTSNDEYKIVQPTLVSRASRLRLFPAVVFNQ